MHTAVLGAACSGTAAYRAIEHAAGALPMANSWRGQFVADRASRSGRGISVPSPRAAGHADFGQHDGCRDLGAGTRGSGIRFHRCQPFVTEAVRNDTERLRSKLLPEAVILWHDYSETVSAERGVGRYLRELMATKDNIFICPETDLAFEVPRRALFEGLERVPAWHPAGDYFQRRPTRAGAVAEINRGVLYSMRLAMACACRQSSAARKACSCVMAFSVRLRQSRMSWPKNG